MTWQDELRRLEDDLAAGRVSAEDYRIRRDQLLSSANASPPPNTSGDDTQIIPPIRDDAQPTQVVGRSGQQQQASPQQYQQGYQQGVPQQPAQPPTQQPAQPRPGILDQPPQDDNEPPWAGNQFPPVSAGSSEWVKQGPEVSRSDNGARGKLVGIIAGVVLIALLGVGAWLLFGQSSGGQKQASGDHATEEGKQAGKPKKKPNPLGIVTPKGQPEAHDDVTDMKGLKGANYLTPREQQAYTDAVTSKTVFKVSHDGKTSIVLVGAKTNSSHGAEKAAKALNDAQLSTGMKPASGHPPKGIYVAQLHDKPPNNSEIRAHYAHGSTIVRVHVYGKQFKSVQRDFDATLSAQRKSLSADG